MSDDKSNEEESLRLEEDDDSTMVIELEEPKQKQEAEDTRTVFEKNLDEPIKNEYTKYGMRFTGTALGYYKIWIVNLILSILTLGIYSAWAKVRKQKYLYNHTSLVGEHFDFHANPVNILKGRLLVAAIYGGFLLLGKLYPPASGVLILVFMIMFPWMIVRAMVFRMNNTSYRNIRFGFKKSYRESYAVTIKTYIVSIITLGIGSIWGINKSIDFIANNMKYGKKKFRYIGSSKPLYKSIFLGVTAFITVAAGFSLLVSPYITEGNSIYLVSLISASVYVVGLGISALMASSIFNNTLNHLHLDGIAFRGQATTGSYFGLLLGNLIILVITLGLGYPITTLRNHRYKVAKARLRVPNAKGLDGFVAESRQTTGTLAEAADDFWDLDIGF